MNIGKLMKQAQEMQSRLQETVSGIEVSQTVGGGMVEVRMAGDKSLRSVRIDPEVLDPDDPEMLQDLIVSAVNEAARKVDEEMKGALGGMAPGLGIPGL